VSVSAGHSSLSTNEQPTHWWLRVPRWLATTLALLLIALTAVLSILGPFLVEEAALLRAQSRTPQSFHVSTGITKPGPKSLSSLWAEIRNGTPKSVFLGPIVPREDFSLLPRLRGVQQLDLTCPQLRDEDFASVAKVSGLKWLTLSSTPLTVEGVRHLDGLPIETVELQSMTLPPGVLERLSRLPNLMRLMLRGCTFDEQDFASFRHHPRLEDLRLYDMCLSDRNLGTICSLPALRTLGVKCTCGSNTKLERLPESMALEYLLVAGLDFTDEHLISLRIDPEHLLLEETGVTFGEATEAWLKSRKRRHKIRVPPFKIPASRIKFLNTLGPAQLYENPP
jgi:hypothetical protein